ncbi:MAG: hypothetical protein QUS09_06280 [Methanotrichaceae archaeon]|nr:hypothetical protein [Methanotrichaceae archaeon]
MRIVFALAVILIVCLLDACGYAQSMNRAQYVGGNFGQSWIGYNTQTHQPAGQNSGNDLWTWGGAPKGSIIVNGKLAPDPYYIWKSLNYTSGWLGEVYIDPSTGYPVYGYIDPYTGMVIYFYVDPKTGKPVYTNAYPATRYPYYGTYYDIISPVYSSNYWPGYYVLPPVFNTNDPWR